MSFNKENHIPAEPVKEIEASFEIENPNHASLTFFNHNGSLTSSIAKLDESRNMNVSNLQYLLEYNCSGG
jgi:hypothetical protein